MTGWCRWLARLDPMAVIVTLALVVFLCSLGDFYLTRALAEYRRVIWFDDTGVHWQARELQQRELFTSAHITAIVIQVAVLILLPVAAAISAFTVWGKINAPGPDRDELDLSIATNTLLFMHRDMQAPFKAAATALTTERLEAAGAVRGAMHDGEIAGYRSGDVAVYLEEVSKELEHLGRSVDDFYRSIHEFDRAPRDDDSGGGQAMPIADVVSRILNTAGTLHDGAWTVPDGDRAHFTMRLQVQGAGVQFARVAVAPFYVKKILEGAISNAVRSVRRYRSKHAPRPLPAGGEVEVTVHATNEHVWVYVLDTGMGLQGQAPLELAIPRGRRDDQQRPGFGFGLYTAFGLERLNVCSYFLTDASDGGALVRISFQRDELECASSPGVSNE